MVDFWRQERGQKGLFIPVFSTYTTLVVHEAIGVLYASQQGAPLYQACAGLLLPIMKFVSRYFQMSLLRHSDEGLGSSIISFEVEFFNSLYTSVFLQTTDNLLCIVTLSVIDVIENCLDADLDHAYSTDLLPKP